MHSVVFGQRRTEVTALRFGANKEAGPQLPGISRGGKNVGNRGLCANAVGREGEARNNEKLPNTTGLGGGISLRGLERGG